MTKEKINILGGGPVGSLLSIMLIQKGFQVNVFEKRDDPRKTLTDEGRSINLALSHRGIHALKSAGVFSSLEELLIPMEGRMMHDIQEELTFQPYGKEGQSINSISRARLTQILCDEAEHAGVNFFFNHKCMNVDLDTNQIELDHLGETVLQKSDYLFGADGAFSVLRKTYEADPGYNTTLSQLSYGYKELNLVPHNGEFAFEPNYLHIWPRNEFMLIALPNPEKNFTCTLFLPLEGEVSFDKLKTDEEIKAFFANYFPDVNKHMPNVVRQFNLHPTSNLNIVNCFPWTKNKSMIIGDAAHAIVPFYGQGMNAGFEDCRVLMNIADKCDYDWEVTFRIFEETRKKDADAISSLALKNFVEMREKVADENFLNRKRLEARLHNEYPEIWLPMYSMVTFTDMPYSECLEVGMRQQEVLDQIKDWSDPSSIDLEPLIEMFNGLVPAGRQAYL